MFCLNKYYNIVWNISITLLTIILEASWILLHKLNWLMKYKNLIEVKWMQIKLLKFGFIKPRNADYQYDGIPIQLDYIIILLLMGCLRRWSRLIVTLRQRKGSI